MQPNVIMILIDDLGWMDLSCQGSSFYETPHIDQLRKEGMAFASSLCRLPGLFAQPRQYSVRQVSGPLKGDGLDRS